MVINHDTRLVLVAASVSLMLLAGCTPSPKYHGHGRAPAKKERPVTQERRAPAWGSIVLSPPVRNFSRSRITSAFGKRKNPSFNTVEFHKGIDIKAGPGEEVLAAAGGTVTFAGRQRGFGNTIIIDHGGRFHTVYGHLNVLQVSRGQAVKKGDVIGIIGRTGNATGLHLHFEVRHAGEAVNPLKYL